MRNLNFSEPRIVGSLQEAESGVPLRTCCRGIFSESVSSGSVHLTGKLTP
jgi:hypothetical protein